MMTKIFTLLSVAVLLIAWIPSRHPASLLVRPTLHVEPVYDKNCVVVSCRCYYSVPLKAGGEFRYRRPPELEAFIATNGAALR